MMHSIKPTFHAVSLLLLAFVLAGCVTQAPPSTTPTTPSDPALAAAKGDYERAANLYLNASTRTSDPKRRKQLRLEAGLAAAQAGNASMARPLLASVQESTLSDLDRSRYGLARREISIAGLRPDQALVQLPPPNSGVPPEVAERVWEKRAQLHFAENDLIAGIGDLVQRSTWLVEDSALRGNDERIYDRALDAIAFGQGPQSRAARSAAPATLGWLALADIGQRRWASRGERDQALADWEQRYPGHPATRSVLQDQFDYAPVTQPPPAGEPGVPFQGALPRPSSDTVALALPITGRFANAAEAIRDGFLFAYGNTRTSAPPPLIYDSNTLSAREILEKAQRQNVGILVGPLDKPKVAEIGQLESNIPEIALNYTDTQINRPGFYEFALAPEDEAAAVARRASERGYARALALVPKGDWGSRVFDAFRAQFNKDGGRVINYATYESTDRDYREPIQSVLRSYRGQGADFIFVAARPVQARLIRSQLRFYRATNLPMLATSHAYTGTVDSDEDIDLDGVGFADMPWVIGSGNFLDKRRSGAQARYGAVAERYSRLFAMGMDAWRLTHQIAKDGLTGGDVLEGMTGVLAVQPDGHISRYLAWAVFRNGVPQLVKMPSTSDARLDSTTTPAAPWRQR